MQNAKRNWIREEVVNAYAGGVSLGKGGHVVVHEANPSQLAMPLLLTYLGSYYYYY